MHKLSQKGFTILELLVVISIIWVLAMMTSGLDFNKKTDLEKRDRINAKLSAVIISAKTNMTTGKWIKSGTGIITPSTTEVLISSGSILTRYYSGQTVVGTWEVFTSPFFGEPWYVLKSFYYMNKNLTTTGAITNPISILFDTTGNMSFTGETLIDSAVIIGLTTGYNSSLKTFEFDRRSGRVTIR